MNGRYKAYPEYKDSGVEWLKEMPVHWELIKTKYIFKKVQRVVRPEDGIVTAFRDGEVTLRSNRRTDGFTNAAKEIGYQGVRKGDLLVHAMDGFAGAIGISDSEGKCSPVCSVCIPWDLNKINTNYYGYLVRQLAVTDYISSLSKGIRERSTEFRFSEFSALFLAVPPKIEQQKIADFLDHETAKIDTLIAKQEKLIELLKEKRQAVISYAVTKGLNPNAPMKDSGVEWLGEVPEHWDISKITYLGECQNGLNIGGEAFGSGYPFISYGDVYKNSILPKIGSGLVQSSISDRERYSIKFGDVFFTRTSETIEEIGFSSTCFHTIKDATFAGFLIRFRPNQQRLVTYFSKYYFRANILRAFFVGEMNLVTRASLSQELLKRMTVVIPPLSEQEEISVFLDKKEHTFHKLIKNAEITVSLLNERKTALISAAVTGKIDVRDWVAPSSQKDVAA